jgi:LacI family transcriptional regulator, galactose operon repressor
MTLFYHSGSKRLIIRLNTFHGNPSSGQTAKLDESESRTMPEHKRLAIYDIAGKTTRTIGVIVHTLDSHFIISALRGIQKVTSENGYDCVITHSQNCTGKEIANARLLFQCRVEGVLASPVTQTTSVAPLTCLPDNGIPVVFFGHAEQIRGAGRVIIDNYRCGYLATEHLIRQGFTRIVLVTSALKQVAHVRQYRGFLEALKRYGMTRSGELLITEDIETDVGAEVAQKVLRMHPTPDGLFITDDQTAVRCIHALNEAGIRVPQEIGIVGLNNDPVGTLITPALTTIDCPGFEIGQTAASTLLDQLSGSRKAGQRTTAVVPPALIIRNSSMRCCPGRNPR